MHLNVVIREDHQKNAIRVYVYLEIVFVETDVLRMQFIVYCPFNFIITNI